MENENKKPIIFLILKIIGAIFVMVGIVGCVISSKGFGDFESNNFMIGGIMASIGFFIGISCLATGFIPQMSKLSIKTTKYLQQENKEDLTDIADTSADIASGAITKTAKAVKTGLKDTIFCKHCGAEIDKDSTFCKSCGKQQ